MSNMLDDSGKNRKDGKKLSLVNELYLAFANDSPSVVSLSRRFSVCETQVRKVIKATALVALEDQARFLTDTLRHAHVLQLLAAWFQHPGGPARFPVMQDFMSFEF